MKTRAVHRSGRPPAGLAALLRAYRGDQGGATAVEFSMVALPLLFLLFSLLELAIVFLISVTLENATYNAARTIRTGQMQTSGMASAASLKTAICSNLTWLGSSCSSRLEVDVRTYANFTNPTIPDPVSGGAFNAAALTFTPGNAGDIVLVRAFYKWPLLTPFLNGGLQRLSGGITVLTAASLFKNEPYS
jgi:Flp pilus assembly protein TadG